MGSLVFRIAGGTASYSNTYSVDFERDSTQHLTADNNTDLDYDGSSDFSISFWMKPEQDGNALEMILGKGGAYDGGEGYFIRRNSNEAIQVEFNGSTYPSNYLFKTTTSGVTNSGSWYHIVVVYHANGSSASSVDVYIDNSANALSSTPNVSSLTTQSISTTATATIGRNLGTTHHYDGLLDEVSYWGKALSSSEVSELYNSGTPTDLSEHSATSDLQHWYRMGDHASDDLTADTGQITDAKGSVNLTPKNTTSSNKVEDTPGS